MVFVFQKIMGFIMAKIERTKNAARNIVFGVTLKAYQVIVPFVIRTAIIYLLGVQYLGLSSLFSSILQVLNLAELGVGSAMVYSMYKPIAEDDNISICALMKLYRTYYRVIGLVILLLGIIITPFIPKLVSGEIPKGINLYLLYYINLASTVLSYWLFAYRNSLLQAHQRIDVISKITFATNTFQYILQIMMLWFFRNYYYYVIAALATQALTNIFTAIYSVKMYPDYKPRGNFKKEEVRMINQRIKDIFTSKLGTVLGTSVDSIVISASLGLSVLAIYHNYYFIMNAISGFILIIFTSISAGVGNSLIVEDPDKNYKDFRKLVFIILWIVTVCISCFATVFQPFMIIWVGDKLKLPYINVIQICIYFFVSIVQNLSCAYKDAAGIWHEDRFRPLISGGTNLVLNIFLVKIWGLSGIIIATIICYIFIAIPWVVKNLFKFVFKRKPWEYIRQIVSGFFIAVIIASASYYICTLFQFDGIFEVTKNIIISVVLSNFSLYIIYRNSDLMGQVIETIKNVKKQ